MGKAMFGAAALAILAGAATTFGGEEKIGLDAVPAPALQAVKDRFPRGELLGAAKDTDHGAVTYEVQLKRGGVVIDVTVTAEGKIAIIETAIAVEDLPRPVAATLAAKHPNQKIVRAEEVVKVRDGKEVLEYFEAVVMIDGEEVEVEIHGDGKLVSADQAPAK